MKIWTLIIISLILASSCLAGEKEHPLVKPILNHIKETYTQSTQKNFNQKDRILETETSVIYNIYLQQNKIDKLRFQGVKEDELNKMMRNSSKMGDGIIQGTVYEEDGMTPIKDRVTITAYDEYGYYSGSSRADSSTKGLYSISYLTTGIYYVKATSSLFKEQYYKNVANWLEATLVNVIDGSLTDKIDFTLQRNNYKGAISGRVTDIARIPIPNCYVLAVDDNWNGSLALPDTDGHYIVGGLRDGNYNLQVNFFGDGNFVNEWYDNVQHQSKATTISITNADTIKNINFILEVGGVIAGRAYYAPSTPVGAYACQIEIYDVDQNEINYTYTDDDGYFYSPLLMSGNYKILVNSSGSISEWYENSESFENSKTITVTAPDTTGNINIFLKEPGSISGHVYGTNGQPLKEFEFMVELECLDNDDISGMGTTIDRNGFYKFESLPKGRYRLFAQHQKYTSNPTGEEPANEWYDGVYRKDLATIVQVSPSEQKTNIDFTLEKGGYITGLILGTTGPLNPGGWINAYNEENDLIQKIDLNQNVGPYNLVGLATGDYKLVINLYGRESDIYMNEWYNGKYNFEGATPVRVEAGQGTKNINFKLDEKNFISGFIKDADGKAVPNDDGMGLVVYVYVAKTGFGIESESASFIGGYKFELMNGTYKLQVINSYINSSQKYDDLAATYFLNGKNFEDENSQEILLQDGRTLKLQDISMEHVPGAISGTIFKEEAQPAINSSYLVAALDKDGFVSGISLYIDAVALTDGNYLITGLRPGTYFLFATIGTWILEDGVSEWYGGGDLDVNTMEAPGKITIPESAIPVTVENSMVSGIDFHFYTTGINNIEYSIKKFELKQNYPNPFNPITTIQYELAEPFDVTMTIYDIRGQEIQTLVNKRQDAGHFVIQWDGCQYANGIYFCRMRAGQSFETIRKMILIK